MDIKYNECSKEKNEERTQKGRLNINLNWNLKAG